MVGSCEHSTEHSCSRKGREIYGEMNDYQLLNMGSPSSYLTPEPLIYRACKTSNRYRFDLVAVNNIVVLLNLTLAHPASGQRELYSLCRGSSFTARVNLANGPVSGRRWAMIGTQLPLSAGCIIPSIQIHFYPRCSMLIKKGRPTCTLLHL
jgi:hypothetical protein